MSIAVCVCEHVWMCAYMWVREHSFLIFILSLFPSLPPFNPPSIYVLLPSSLCFSLLCPFFFILFIWPIIMSSAISTMENTSFIICIWKKKNSTRKKLNISVFSIYLWIWNASCQENYLLKLLGSCSLHEAHQPIAASWHQLRYLVDFCW